MDSTESTPPTAEQIAAAQESATALVASSVADLVVLIEGADLLTLQYALAAEQAKGEAARKGALAALEAAVDGHPENAASAAAAADAPAVEPAPVIEEPQPEPEPAPAEPEAPAEEPDADLDLAPASAPEGFFPMHHPDGGSCDAYETDADGYLLVPYADAGVMQSHGFAVVTAE